jgi:hypothetical protein
MGCCASRDREGIPAMGFSREDLKIQKERYLKAGQGHIFDLYN